MRFYLLLSSFLLLYLSSFAQKELYKRAIDADDSGNTELAIDLYKKSISLAEREKDYHFAGEIRSAIATLLYQTGDYQAASAFCEKGIAQLTKHHIKKDTVWFKLYAAQAPSYKNQYLIQKAINSYHQANKIVEISPEIENQIPLHVGYHFFNQGIFWLKIYDVAKAKLNFDRALNIGLKIKNNELVVDAMINLGSIYGFESDYEKGIVQLMKANELIEKNQYTQPLDRARSRLYLAVLYLRSNQIAKATQLLDAIIMEEQTLKQKVDGRNVFTQAILQRIQIPDASNRDHYLEKIGEVKSLATHLQAEYYVSIASAEINLKNYNAAIAAYEEALAILDLKYDSKWMAVDLIKCFNIVAKLSDANYQQYLRSKNEQNFKSAIENSKKCLAIAEEIRNEQYTFESKLFFSERNYLEYKKAIGLLLQLYELKKEKHDLNDFFAISENAKSYLMNVSQIRNDYKRNPKEDSLALKLSAYKSYIAYLNSKETAKDQVSEFEQKANLVLNELSLSARKTNKIGRNLSFDLSDISHIPENQLYVNYIIQDKDLIIICLSQNGVVTKKLPLDLKTFNKHRKVLQSALENPPSPFEGFQHITSCTYLYEILINSLPVNLSKFRRLAINPDNALFDFSFDILQNPATSQYLIEEVAISYVVSANDLIPHSNSSSISSKCKVFLPFANKGDIMYKNLQPLKFSLERSKGLNADFYLDQKASKATFLEVIKDSHSITMISTHAVAEGAEPYLFFDENNSLNSRLYASELPYFEVNSPLIVLNACQSNRGEKVNGMGLMSLSESFRIAGGQSVLGSMWQADEESTAIISSLFYRYVMKGLPKDVALQKAKLDFLKSEVGKRNDLPFYWAHLQLMGQSSALKKDRTYYYLLAFLLLAFLFYVIKKMNSKRAEI